MLDSMNFSNIYSHAVGDMNLLKFQSEYLQRNLKLEIYTTATNNDHHTNISRFNHSEYNVNKYDHFIINNYRQELSFSYLTWKIIDSIKRGEIGIN
jgi:hypothetical protein